MGLFRVIKAFWTTRRDGLGCWSRAWRATLTQWTLLLLSELLVSVFSVKLAFVVLKYQNLRLSWTLCFLLRLKTNHWFNWNFVDSHGHEVVHSSVVSVCRSSWNHQICQVAKALMCVIPLTAWQDVTFSSYPIIIHTDGRSGCQVSSFNCVVFYLSWILWGPKIRVNVAESTSGLLFFSSLLCLSPSRFP